MELQYKNNVAGYHTEKCADYFYTLFDTEIDPKSRVYLSEDYLFWMRILANQEIYGFSNITCNLVMHDERSMKSYNGDKNLIRQKIFLQQLQNDNNFKRKYNHFFGTIKSSSYLLVALDYSIERKIFNSLKFLFYAIKIEPSFIFSKRPYAIIKRIFFTIK